MGCSALDFGTDLDEGKYQMNLAFWPRLDQSDFTSQLLYFLRTVTGILILVAFS